MLKIRNEDKILSRPVICCDECDKEITTADGAIVYWNNTFILDGKVDGTFGIVTACLS